MKIVGGGYRDENDLRNLGIGAVGPNVRIHETAILVDIERIEIGSNVRIDPFCVLSAAGGYIRLGSYIHIASQSNLIGGYGIEMEDFSGISQGVKIYSASDDYSGASLTNPTVPKRFLNIKSGLVRLGRHVIIGSGSAILPGVVIEEGSAVGAMSLVTKSLDAWGVYSGVPVKRLKGRKRDLLVAEAELVAAS